MAKNLLGSLLRKKLPAPAPVKLSLPAAIAKLEEGEIPENHVRDKLLSILDTAAQKFTINAGYPRSGPRGSRFVFPNGGAVTIRNTRPTVPKTLPYKGDTTEPNFLNRIEYLKSIRVYSEENFFKDAPTGVFTWILYRFQNDASQRLHFAAMHVETEMEYGTGHESIVRSIQESEGKTIVVLFAGEMMKGMYESLTINLLSGTFMLKIIKTILNEYIVPDGEIFLNEHLLTLAHIIIQELLVPEEEGEIISVGGTLNGKTFITVASTPITDDQLKILQNLDFSVIWEEPKGAMGGAGAKMNLSGGGRRSRRNNRKGRKSRRLVRGRHRK